MAKWTIELQDDDLELLLFQFLQEFLYYKDAEQLLLRSETIEIAISEEKFYSRAEAAGESLDANKHDLVVDVKAVTMHHFSVAESKGAGLRLSSWIFNRTIVILTDPLLVAIPFLV